MIDLFNEDIISLSQAAKVMPAVDGKRVHTSTVFRWCKKGVRGVRLEYSRLGRRIVTSREALSRFGAALADADKTPRASSAGRSESPTRTPAERRRAMAAAEARLAKRGL